MRERFLTLPLIRVGLVRNRQGPGLLRSLSSSQSKIKPAASVFPFTQSFGEDKADDFADTIIKSLKLALKISFTMR